jgi:hypothetical protein
MPEIRKCQTQIFGGGKSGVCAEYGYYGSSVGRLSGSMSLFLNVEFAC